MPQVIRYGQKAKPKTTASNKWPDAQVLQAFWDMEEQITGRPSPTRRQELNLNIPELHPVPVDKA